MAALSIGKAWEESIVFIKREGALLFPVSLLFLAIPFAIVLQMIPAEYLQMTPAGAGTRPPLAGSVMLAIAVAVGISLIGLLTLYALALKPGISVREALALGVGRLPVLFGAMLLAVLAYVLAVLVVSAITAFLAAVIGTAGAAALALALLLPVIMFLAARLLLLQAVIVDQSAGPVASLKAAWRLTGGHVWRLLGFTLIFFALALIVQMAVQTVFGVIFGLLAGPEGARAAGEVAVAIVSGIFQVYFLVMTARLYRQLQSG